MAAASSGSSGRRPAEQGIDRFAQRPHRRRDTPGIGDRQRPADLVATKHRRGGSEARDLGRIVEAIEAPLRIAAVDDRVGRVEGEDAPEKRCCGPRDGHAVNLTCKSHLTS